MPRRPDDDRATRGTARLSREAIVTAGIALADRDGPAGVSMRRLATDLGVNPMSLYHHVRDKDALLDAMIDTVVAGITPAEDPRDGPLPWTEDVRALVLAARRTMLRHPWAVRVILDRHTPTPATLRHVDRLLAAMRRGGCSVELGHHALHLLGSRMLGFSQDLFVDAAAEPGAPDPSAEQVRQLAQLFPHVAELAASASHDGGLGGCDDDAEFDFALDVLLDGLERRRLAEAGGPRPPRPPGPGRDREGSDDR